MLIRTLILGALWLALTSCGGPGGRSLSNLSRNNDGITTAQGASMAQVVRGI